MYRELDYIDVEPTLYLRRMSLTGTIERLQQSTGIRSLIGLTGNSLNSNPALPDTIVKRYVHLHSGVDLTAVRHLSLPEHQIGLIMHQRILPLFSAHQIELASNVDAYVKYSDDNLFQTVMDELSVNSTIADEVTERLLSILSEMLNVIPDREGVTKNALLIGHTTTGIIYVPRYNRIYWT